MRTLAVVALVILSACSAVGEATISAECREVRTFLNDFAEPYLEAVNGSADELGAWIETNPDFPFGPEEQEALRDWASEQQELANQLTSVDIPPLLQPWSESMGHLHDALMRGLLAMAAGEMARAVELLLEVDRLSLEADGLLVDVYAHCFPEQATRYAMTPAQDIGGDGK